MRTTSPQRTQIQARLHPHEFRPRGSRGPAPGILEQAGDADGDILLARLVTADTSLVSAAVDFDGALRATPATDFEGTAELVAAVSDGMHETLTTIHVPLAWGSEDSVLSMLAEGPTLGLSSGKALRPGQPELFAVRGRRVDRGRHCLRCDQPARVLGGHGREHE
ncbi:MAG: hypothetical protein HY791_01320 [Deltaproteobacteria bacterium]|nr:hypothetical protein [Deltaproteobacteria bacterium]